MPDTPSSNDNGPIGILRRLRVQFIEERRRIAAELHGAALETPDDFEEFVRVDTLLQCADRALMAEERMAANQI